MECNYGSVRCVWHSGVEATTRRASSGPCRSLRSYLQFNRRAPDRAPCKGRGGRSVGVVAEDLGGIGRSGRAGAGGFDAGQASFSQAINRERLSRVHLVSAGRPGSDRALLQSPRLTLAIDALLRVYDHVLLDAGTASDLSAELLTAQARAVVVPDASMADDARTLMCDQLKAVGFTEVTMLSKPSQPLNALEPGPRVAAA